MAKKKTKKASKAVGKAQGETVIYTGSKITDMDIYHFKEGSHFRLYDKLGSTPTKVNSVDGTSFALWAPNASRVSVIGDFNGWNNRTHPLSNRPDSSGIWEGFIPGVLKGAVYKYHVTWSCGSKGVDKADPFAFYAEEPPKSASIVWQHDYRWNDDEWMAGRGKKNSLDAPLSIYELHIGSWRRVVEEDNRSLSYRELAGELASYIKETGFTHVELMPVMEHPFYGSWGYQITGYFAPSSRFGEPEDLMYLIDLLHQNDIGVILDWVPSHFPSDEHGLAYFDGTELYEHADPKKGFHPEWKSFVFNYGRHEVASFLISNAIFWLDKFHIDGLRVDAVASMLYLDYAREEGEWIPNEYGGKENLEAVEFVKSLNTAVYKDFPDVQTIAEESTSWPMVTRPVHDGGLGFGEKWNMGWMHDTLEYFSKDPVHRKHHHYDLTFSICYAFSENFLLPLSHDEVVHGKGSLLARMPGDEWQRFANLRALYGYMYAHPGKKLLFMGNEFGQLKEWDHDSSLDWHLLDKEHHKGLKRWVSDLNRFYATTAALFETDFDGVSFEWIDCHNKEDSIFTFIRRGRDSKEIVLFIANLTPVPREDYRVELPSGGKWQVALNSDKECYGGSDVGTTGTVVARKDGFETRPYSISVTLPPLGVMLLTNSTEKK